MAPSPMKAMRFTPPVAAKIFSTCRPPCFGAFPALLGFWFF
jgi:hypothetical protein